ncbi:MAG: metal ABC transporter permease [Thermoleophilia bacterium]|nr:metal ABC transporter permease [Thermoleophilia bacterium]
MNDDLTIIVTAGLVATACGLLGPFLVLRRVALMGDAVSHAVLPGIVAVYLLLDTRAPLPVVVGAAAFAVVCVLAIDALRGTGLVASDAAIGLVFPALFAIGVLGIDRYADSVHLDLDSTIYGEIAFVPFRTLDVLGVEVAQAVVVLGAVTLVNLVLVAVFWKPLKATSFDPEFSRTVGISPVLVSRLLLVAVAVTAVAAFEAVGAILVVTLIIVPAATAYLLTDRLWMMVAVAVGVGWLGAVLGYGGALRADASIAGAMGLVCAVCFVVAFLCSPRHGLLARAVRRSRRRRALARAIEESATA